MRKTVLTALFGAILSATLFIFTLISVSTIIATLAVIWQLAVYMFSHSTAAFVTFLVVGLIALFIINWRASRTSVDAVLKARKKDKEKDNKNSK